jgi:hypothetical protein
MRPSIGARFYKPIAVAILTFCASIRSVRRHDDRIDSAAQLRALTGDSGRGWRIFCSS